MVWLKGKLDRKRKYDRYVDPIMLARVPPRHTIDYSQGFFIASSPYASYNYSLFDFPFGRNNKLYDDITGYSVRLGYGWIFNRIVNEGVHRLRAIGKDGHLFNECEGFFFTHDWRWRISVVYRTGRI